jgi:hypothetical protein
VPLADRARKQRQLETLSEQLRAGFVPARIAGKLRQKIRRNGQSPTPCGARVLGASQQSPPLTPSFPPRPGTTQNQCPSHDPVLSSISPSLPPYHTTHSGRNTSDHTARNTHHTIVHSAVQQPVSRTRTTQSCKLGEKPDSAREGAFVPTYTLVVLLRERAKSDWQRKKNSQHHIDSHNHSPSTYVVHLKSHNLHSSSSRPRIELSILDKKVTIGNLHSRQEIIQDAVNCGINSRLKIATTDHHDDQ